jgi:hypothetical protein
MNALELRERLGVSLEVWKLIQEELPDYLDNIQLGGCTVEEYVSMLVESALRRQKKSRKNRR